MGKKILSFRLCLGLDKQDRFYHAIYGNNDPSYIRINATSAGTTIIKPNGSGHLYAVSLNINQTGTMTYYDGTSVASGSIICLVPNAGSKVPDVLPYLTRTTNGLIAVNAGSVDQSVFWD